MGSLESRMIFFFWNITLLLTIVRIMEASDCTEEQISSCKAAAASDNISESPGGGVCQPKSYVHFTHLCTVTNYIPSINHCCCAQAEQVFCCRYHYDWNYFRCVEADDTIQMRSSDTWPQEILLTIILVPTISGLLCIFCCVRCLCCHGDDEDGRKCGCSKCVCACENKKKNSAEATQLKPYDQIALKVPQSQSEKACPSDDRQYVQHMTTISAAQYSSVPSAPPLDDPVTLGHLQDVNHYSIGGHLMYNTRPSSRVVLQYVSIMPDVCQDTATRLDQDFSSEPLPTPFTFSDIPPKINLTNSSSQNIDKLISNSPKEPPPDYDQLMTQAYSQS